MACEPEPVEALPPPEDVPEPVEADPVDVEPLEPLTRPEPTAAQVVAAPAAAVTGLLPPPPSPPPPVEGTGTDGTLTSGVETGPTVTEGTFTSGVDDGVGTLVPPGRSIAAGAAVMVGAAASRQTSDTSVTTVASVALRKTPAHRHP